MILRCDLDDSVYIPNARVTHASQPGTPCVDRNHSDNAIMTMARNIGLLIWILVAINQTVVADRPNVLMIMVDDLGFSDLGCYGSEIETPNLDALAAEGLRFTQFYNTAKCHSSRVSLLTGQYCIAAGDTRLTSAVTSAEVLQAGGYFTAMTGKWHLKGQPTDFGFQRFFGHLSGACNYFLGDHTFRLNGQPWAVPESGFYTTIANVDYGLKFLDEAGNSGKPWHLYVAFNAPHAPLQALPYDYAKYEKRYAAGWDRVRDTRVERQRELGLLPSGFKESPRPTHVPAWDSLSEPRRRFEEKRMATLAAMIDRVDQEVGRLVRYLKTTGQFDNTLIWFVSDNGACPYDRRSDHLEKKPTDGSVRWSDSTGWAWARNSPFRFYKQNQFEGGICTPAIVHWPQGLKTPPGSICRQPAHLIDVMPTFADLTESSIPSEFGDRQLRPVSGQSLRPIFEGDKFVREQPLHFLFASDRGLRVGDWKAVSFRSGPWELYNLKEDRTELDDRSADQPSRLASMVQQWTDMARDLLHAKPNSYAPVSKAGEKFHPEWTDFSRDPSASRSGNAKSGDPKSGARPSKAAKPRRPIRARKHTQLKIHNDELQLTFTGPDPGLAIDQLPTSLPAGPYVLSFELNSSAKGDGELFFTTDAKTSLPKGTRVPFAVTADGEWHEHSIRLATEKRIQKLRLDVSEDEGTARIRNLVLQGGDGIQLMQWPKQARHSPGPTR